MFLKVSNGENMRIEEEIFKKSKISEEKLMEFGFGKQDNKYIYSKNILDNKFRIDIYVQKGNIAGKVFDNNINEEYTNFRINSIKGDFVGKVREQFINLLNDIKEKCTINSPFIFEQSNRIAKYIKENYNDDPIFKWDKFPGYAIFKNDDTNKWYGIIMNLDKSKLDKKTHSEVEIIDIKLNPDKIQKLIDYKGFFPAYHMNKTNWICILLDDTIKDEEVMSLIDESYKYSLSKK